MVRRRVKNDTKTIDYSYYDCRTFLLEQTEKTIQMLFPRLCHEFMYSGLALLLSCSVSDQLLLERCNLLLFNLVLFLLLALRLNGKLIRTPDGNVLGTEVTEQLLKHLLNDPAATVIENHNGSHGDLELGGEGDKLQLLVDLGHELGCAGECNSSNHDNTVVHALVLLDGLTERTTLVVNGEGGNLLDQLQEVDGRVEKRGLEFTLEIDIGLLGLGALHVSGNVDQNVGLRSLLGKCFNGLEDTLASIESNTQRLTYLGTRDGEEADTHQHTTDGDLTIAELDTVKVQHTQTVGRDQAVQSQDLVHLDGSNESATTLADDVRNGDNVGQLTSERSSNRGITKLDSRRFVVVRGALVPASPSLAVAVAISALCLASVTALRTSLVVPLLAASRSIALS
ncbi:putative cation transporting ATPase, partial [Aureobasidium melanogenum]